MPPNPALTGNYSACALILFPADSPSIRIRGKRCAIPQKKCSKRTSIGYRCKETEERAKGDGAAWAPSGRRRASRSARSEGPRRGTARVSDAQHTAGWRRRRQQERGGSYLPPPPTSVAQGARFSQTGRGATFKGGLVQAHSQGGTNGSPCVFSPFYRHKGGPWQFKQAKGPTSGGASSGKRHGGAQVRRGVLPVVLPGNSWRHPWSSLRGLKSCWMGK